MFRLLLFGIPENDIICVGGYSNLIVDINNKQFVTEGFNKSKSKRDYIMFSLMNLISQDNLFV